jgi:crotonobetainyl-CoA:carnitine CoA-transferase CaiB-like acyl-CoA transferase
MPQDPQRSPATHALPLSGLRVLEVAEMVAGPYCGKLLASLGAEVIKVEAPGTGDPSRRRGPFPGDVPHAERSGTFLYLNTGKQGITLDLEDTEGRVLLEGLASRADVVVHDRQPARAQEHGLDAARLGGANPRLIVAAVTPFGSYGPYAGYRAYDINVFHAGGEGYLLPNGLALETFPDRAPLVAGSHMGSYQGGLTAALGIVAAVYYAKSPLTPLYQRGDGGISPDKEGSGGIPPGQVIDCSLQEAQLSIGYLPIQRLETEGLVEDRFSRFFRVGGVLPAQDGYVELLTLERRQWEGLYELLGRPDWASTEKFEDPARFGPEINLHLREWAGGHTKAWLYDEGQAHGVPIAPYFTPSEVFSSRQQRERGFFVPLDHPAAGCYEYPGLPYRFGVTGEVLARAPLLGEHNQQVYQDLGYSPKEIVALARAGVL